MKKRIKAVKKSGSGADQAKKRARRTLEGKQGREAEKILEKTAEYFDLDPTLLIQSGRPAELYRMGRSVLTILLRRRIAWTADRICEFVV